MSKPNPKSLLRRAVTLVEVIFAIGVILIGLLGLLSLMPLAGKRSQHAVGLSVAASMGENVIAELSSRKLLRDGALSSLDARTLDYDPSLAPDQQLALVGATRTPINAFCIDPMYAAKASTGTLFAGFNDRFFPYFAETQDPMLNPSSTGTAWPASQPRLPRIGFGTTNAEITRTVVENSNDLNITMPKDRTLDSRLMALQSNSGLQYGRRVPSGEYSWIATVNRLGTSRFASLSVVVMKNRDSSSDFPTALETEPRRNGVNERLAYVSFASGFNGGAGGMVYLAGAQSTLDLLQANDWIMLSRRVSATQSVHRWYRVASADREALNIVTDSNSGSIDTNLGSHFPTASGTPVWFRKVLLDGPDWSFGLNLSGPTNYVDDTFATIVPGVVAVTERIVQLDQL
ncbi:hypothetical protein Pla52o_24310 [Novipirellula galeiformis]|uniref:Uncharacterized protein n=1 Tax=Novipirellula galeiformis TaxID=2528004 RepID=A0A5C6CJB2_9BACT|nr:hypothetical protein [Novipirellula galeiformis]TWU22899.1 hypothetical protein Pla52o_24310 [Novipirellula galeiformis]